MFSDPVVGADFFGREEILEVFKKRVESFQQGYRQNIALISQQHLGKTSVIHQYLSSLHDPAVLPVYVELKPQALAVFVDQFSRSLLYQYLKCRTYAGAQEPLNVLMERARNHIPRTVKHVEAVQELMERKNGEAAYAQMFELTTHLYRETGIRCLVVLDEFHRLGDFSLKHAFHIFGKRIMVQKDTMYVILSSSTVLSRQILAQKLSLLFGNFEYIDLQPFSSQTAGQFIQKKYIGGSALAAIQVLSLGLAVWSFQNRVDLNDNKQGHNEADRDDYRKFTNIYRINVSLFFLSYLYGVLDASLNE